MPIDATEPAVPRLAKTKPVTGRFVFAVFVAFFGVVALVNGIMMTLAIRTMPGLDVANGYVASQGMNREIEAMRRQAERGWTGDVGAELHSGVARVRVGLTDRSGQPVSGLMLTVRLAHPALTRADHTIALTEIRPGTYASDIAQVQEGAWTVVVEARQNGERVFASRNRIQLSEVVR